MRSADRWHYLVAGLDLDFGDGAVALGMQRRSISPLRSKAADRRPSPPGRQRPRAPRDARPRRADTRTQPRMATCIREMSGVQDFRFLGGAEKCHAGNLRGPIPAEHAGHGCLDAAPSFSSGPIITHQVRPAFKRSTLPSPRKSTCRYKRSSRRLAVMEQNSKCTVRCKIRSDLCTPASPGTIWLAALQLRRARKG